MSKALQKRWAREAKRPIGRMKEDIAMRIVKPCHLACFTCDRFLGHNHACPGVKARAKSDPKELPMCHVDFRTGKMQSPLDYLTGELIAGQGKFYEVAAEGHQGDCSWVVVKKRLKTAG